LAYTAELRVRPVPRPGRGVVTAAAQPPRAVPTLTERVARCQSVEPLDDGLSTAAHGDVTDVAQTLCGPLVEVVVGTRAPSQVARWVTPHVLAVLRQRARLTPEPPAGTYGVPVVRRIVTCRLGAAVEVAAAVDDSHRTRAVAMRLEPHRGVWRVTALELA